MSDGGGTGRDGTPRSLGAVDHTRDWPLTGRSVELAVGTRLLDRPGRSLVLSGAAGVGKSRLAVELAEHLARRTGAVVVRVVASAALTAVPTGTLSSVLRLGGQPTVQATGPRVEDLGTVLSALQDAVVAFGDGRDVIVVVDDAHLLDDVSAAALRQLVVAGSVRLVATVRSGEPVPDDVAALWRTDDGDRLELMALSEAEVGSLVDAVLGAPLAPECTRQLARHSGGNCLALRELVLDGLASERFVLRHGVVRWSPTGVVGPRLVDLVGSWLGTLTAPESTLLLAVALGGEVPARILAGRMDDRMDERAWQAAQAGLEQRGALTVDDKGVVRLGHPLYGEVARASATWGQVAEARAMLIAGFVDRVRPVLGDALAAPGGLAVEAVADLLRLGRWLLDDPGEAASSVHPLDDDERRRLLAVAADQAIRLGDVDGALALADAAIDAGSTASLVVRAEALVRSGRTDEAAEALGRLWREAERPGTEPLTSAVVRRSVQTELTVHLINRHDPQAARVAVDAALTRVGSDEDVAFVRAAHATFLAMAGYLDEAGQAVDALEVADPDEPAVRLRALPGRVAVLVAAGRIDEAVARSDEAVAEAMGLLGELPEGLRWSVSALAHALLTGGHLERLAQLSELGQAFEVVDSEATAFRGLMDGRAALFEGRAARARANLSDAAAWYERRGQRMRVRWLLALLAEAHALAGDDEAARRTAAEAGAADRAGNLADHDADRALAWVAATTVGGERTADGLLGVADRARDAGARPFELLALWDALRLTSSKPARRRILTLAPSIASPLAGLIRAAAGARTAEELETAAEGFAAGRFWLWAAEIGHRAADAHRAEGRRSAAARAAATADGWWDECGRPRSPVLATAASGRSVVSGLTAREAEVAAQAAGGATSRQIAEALGVSVRTVDNLLGRVYVKLGIGGRAELADALG